MKSSDQDYIERAIQILSDAEQTSFSKGVAKDVLLNAGFSEGEINRFKYSQCNTIAYVMLA